MLLSMLGCLNTSKTKHYIWKMHLEPNTTFHYHHQFTINLIHICISWKYPSTQSSFESLVPFMPISVLFVQSEPPPKVLLRSISISIFSQWHSVEAPLGFQADSDSPTLCNWLSSQHHNIWKHQQLQLLSTVHCQAHYTACTVRVQFLGIALHCCCWGFLWWGWLSYTRVVPGGSRNPPSCVVPTFSSRTITMHRVLYKETHCSRLKCLEYFRILLCWCIIVSL